ncbi:PAS domain S-box protein [Citrifermentans bremense]|uniref:PAS domain S-box protein n=1 Tax=Citrifermentans bremense TaxID=60035 RepID=UPI001CF7A667|nr:PAS domain S-box protein [Citrifermentans bremense]
MLHQEPLQRALENRSAATFFDGGVEIIDSSGRILAAIPTGNGKVGTRVQSRDYLAMTLADGKPHISAPYLSGTPQPYPTVTFSTPILRPDGSVAGILAGHKNLMKGGPLAGFAHLQFGKKDTFFILGTNRTIIMHPDQRRVMEYLPPGKSPGLDSIILRNRNIYKAHEDTNSNGEREITAARPLKSADWLVVSQYPASEILAPLDEPRWFFAAAFILTIGIARVLLGFLVGSITSPLLRLIDHVQTLPSKTGKERVLVNESGDEVESLTHAVNEMVETMDRKKEALLKSQEVYHIVADFTSELAMLRNPDQSVRYISANCLALTGYTDREFMETPDLLESIVHPSDIYAWRAHSSDCCRDEDLVDLNLRLVTKQGVPRWFNYTCHAVTSPDGGDLGVRGSFRDISHRVMLEQLLCEQREFARNLLESTSIPLFVIDSDHKVIVWNQALSDLTGIASCDVMGTHRHWQAFYHEPQPTLSDLLVDRDPEGIEVVETGFERVIVQRGNLQAERWFNGISGERRQLLVNASQVLRDGKVVAVVETLHDITARTEAEQSLRLLAQAVEQTASSILIHDLNGEIIYVNNKFCQATGYSKEETLGNNVMMLKMAPEVYEEICRITRSGKPWHGELQSRRKDGTSFWESATISPIADDKGAIIHYLAVKEDITEAKEAEQRLKQQQDELLQKHEQLTELFLQVEKGKREWEQTMDCIDDMVVLVEKDGTIRRCNRAFMSFVRCSFNDLLSCDWRVLLKKVGLDLDGRVDGEFLHQPTQRWLALNAYTWDQGQGEVITLHDLTEVKEVSQQLATAYQELKATHSQLLQQEKMASIGQLAAGVAHEINNPVGFISSNLSTLGKYLERISSFVTLQSAKLVQCASAEVLVELTEARQTLKVDYILRDAPDLVAESMDGADRVRTIVQNLKTFSRVDDAETMYVNLNDCLESTVTIAWNELKYKTTLNRDYGELPPIKCFPHQLNQVFLNLLVNAAHAIEVQGEVTITTRCLGETVKVTISDTGCGIPDEIQNRIFEPFFTTKEVGKGTGLGLSISYDIIKKHGGSIEVESAPGKGTTFSVVLPVEGA